MMMRRRACLKKRYWVLLGAILIGGLALRLFFAGVQSPIQSPSPILEYTPGTKTCRDPDTGQWWLNCDNTTEVPSTDPQHGPI